MKSTILTTLIVVFTATTALAHHHTSPSKEKKYMWYGNEYVFGTFTNGFNCELVEAKIKYAFDEVIDCKAYKERR